MPRPYLVIVRAGDASYHEEWLTQHPNREWDLLVSYFGKTPPAQLQDIEITLADGPKWPVLKALLESNPDRFLKYDYIFFPDDDLQFVEGTIDQLFHICKHHLLKLAQPSLSSTSFTSHSITVHHDRSLLRFTNWVEIMAPCFEQAFLQQCIARFDENISGWGLCLYWSKLLVDRTNAMGVVDAVQARHTRPFFGPNYRHLSEQSVSPMAEMWDLMQRHGIDEPFVRNRGVIDHNGLYIDLESIEWHEVTWQVAPW